MPVKQVLNIKLELHQYLKLSKLLRCMMYLRLLSGLFKDRLLTIEIGDRHA